jgi:hypothetical protein
VPRHSHQAPNANWIEFYLLPFDEHDQAKPHNKTDPYNQIDKTFKKQNSIPKKSQKSASPAKEFSVLVRLKSYA